MAPPHKNDNINHKKNDNNRKTPQPQPQPQPPTAPAFTSTSANPNNADGSGIPVPSEANQSPELTGQTTPLTPASDLLLSPPAKEQIYYEGVVVKSGPKSPRGRLQRNNGGRSASATSTLTPDEDVFAPSLLLSRSLEDEARMNEVSKYNRLKDQTDAEREKAYDQSLALQTERDDALDKQKAAESAKTSLEKDLKNKTTDADNATRDNERLEKALQAKEGEKSAKEKEVGDWKQKFEDMKTLYTNAESDRDEVARQLAKAEEDRDHQTTLKEGLKEELERQDAVVGQVDDVAEQQGAAQEQLDRVLQVFQEEFKQLAEGVDLEGYLQQFRETVQAGRRLRRDDSQASFHQHGLGIDEARSDRPRGGHRQVSTASLGDELKGHGSESGDETGDEDEQAPGDQVPTTDDDPTLKDLDYIHLTPPTTHNWTAGDSISNVNDSLFGEIDTGTQTPASWTHRPTGQPLGLPHIPGIGDRTSMAHCLDWGPGDKGTDTDESIPSPEQLAALRAKAAASAALKVALSNSQGLAATRQQEIEKQFRLAQGYARELKVLRENERDASPAMRDGFEPYRGRAAAAEKQRGEEEKKKEGPVTAETDYVALRERERERSPETRTVFVDRPVPGPVQIKTVVKERVVQRWTVRLPETWKEWSGVVPLWMKLVGMALLVLFLALWGGLVRDRAIWFSVNDLGQQNLIKLTGAKHHGGFWGDVAEWVSGGDLSLMG
ncbi:hypothetical protein LTR78_003043 [Recurvomyces mirabilis]|uniref:Uncharacterized protein n=1 Tax=Recurvomyces mirabilis TaxID=574656 RepID=A0AAE0WRT8_9PEZI|nr:hypothetical protein LTR78_003043 [Recurvomyces mirabilis]KAK5157135.1 hypothetical protein LTS14_004653 [Recurvomyces mirabilis]